MNENPVFSALAAGWPAGGAALAPELGRPKSGLGASPAGFAGAPNGEGDGAADMAAAPKALGALLLEGTPKEGKVAGLAADPKEL